SISWIFLPQRRRSSQRFKNGLGVELTRSRKQESFRFGCPSSDRLILSANDSGSFDRVGTTPSPPIEQAPSSSKAASRNIISLAKPAQPRSGGQSSVGGSELSSGTLRPSAVPTLEMGSTRLLPKEHSQPIVFPLISLHSLEFKRNWGRRKRCAAPHCKAGTLALPGTLALAGRSAIVAQAGFLHQWASLFLPKDTKKVRPNTS